MAIALERISVKAKNWERTYRKQELAPKYILVDVVVVISLFREEECWPVIVCDMQAGLQYLAAEAFLVAVEVIS